MQEPKQTHHQSQHQQLPIIKGQIIGGESEFLLVRQKNDTPLELGELVVCEKIVQQSVQQHNQTQSSTSKTQTQLILCQVIDTAFSSQLSNQNLELISGLHLEESQQITLFEEHLRTYTVAKLKMLLNLTENKSERSLPRLFSPVRTLQSSDITFLSKQTPLNFGFLRSGAHKLTQQVCLDINDVLSHHMLIAATTGKGKSNLMKHLLYSLHTHAGLLVFDPHDEYFGRTQFGLKDHPQWKSQGLYFTFGSKQNIPPGAHTLHINLKTIEPKHITNILDLSQPQIDLLYSYFNKYEESWIEELLKGTPLDPQYKYKEDTVSVVKRRLAQCLDIQLKNQEIVAKGIFTNIGGETTLQTITKHLSEKQTVIVDTSHLSSITELIISSLITNHVYDTYRWFKTTGELATKPVISIVLEEAPRVIGKDVLEKGPNVFGTIAKEGRKFKIGLCAITQLPSLIPKTILANMNTKIILGIELAAERNAIIESASQDLSHDARNIASLDKGEAIISSNFARIATPIAIPEFKKENYISHAQTSDGQQLKKKTALFGV
jgi:uncharacterized protein